MDYATFTRHILIGERARCIQEYCGHEQSSAWLQLMPTGVGRKHFFDMTTAWAWHRNIQAHSTNEALALSAACQFDVKWNPIAVEHIQRAYDQMGKSASYSSYTCTAAPALYLILRGYAAAEQVEHRASCLGHAL